MKPPCKCPVCESTSLELVKRTELRTGAVYLKLACPCGVSFSVKEGDCAEPKSDDMGEQPALAPT